MVGLAWVSAQAADMKSEMEDFIQYYRDKQDTPLTPEDLLKNDLLPVTGTNAGSAGPTTGPKTAAATTKSQAPAAVKKYTPDTRSVRTGVAAQGHTTWLGTPLYKGTGSAAGQYKEGDTATTHVLTPTVYRARTYTGGT
jgi:hypothetical protein